MRLTGLEPALREKPDPKSGASTSSATGAFAGAKVGKKDERVALSALFFRAMWSESVLGAVSFPDNGRPFLLFSCRSAAAVRIVRRVW